MMSQPEPIRDEQRSRDDEKEMERLLSQELQSYKDRELQISELRSAKIAEFLEKNPPTSMVTTKEKNPMISLPTLPKNPPLLLNSKFTPGYMSNDNLPRVLQIESWMEKNFRRKIKLNSSLKVAIRKRRAGELVRVIVWTAATIITIILLNTPGQRSYFSKMYTYFAVGFFAYNGTIALVKSVR